MTVIRHPQIIFSFEEDPKRSSHASVVLNRRNTNLSARPYKTWLKALFSPFGSANLPNIAVEATRSVPYQSLRSSEGYISQADNTSSLM